MRPALHFNSALRRLVAIVAKRTTSVRYLSPRFHSYWCDIPILLIGAAIALCCAFLFFVVVWWRAVNIMAQSAAPNQTGPSLDYQRNEFFAMARFAYERNLDAHDKAYAMQVRRYANPNEPDFDGDGLLDNEERALGTNPRRKDTDGDGLWDSTEIRLGLNPCAKDSQGDGINDGQRDSDKDGFVNLDEQNRGYDPGSANSSPAVPIPITEYQSLDNGAVQWDSFQIQGPGQSRITRSYGHHRKAH